MNRFTCFDFWKEKRLIQSVDPVAIGFGRIGLKRLKFLVISFVGSGSLRAVVKLLNYRGRSEQSRLQLVVSDSLRDYCKLDTTFNNLMGSSIGFVKLIQGKAHKYFEAPSLALELIEIND